MVLINGNYEEDEEWMGNLSGVLGSGGVFAAGACGKCVAAIDMSTKASFCVKIVRTVVYICICMKH